MIEEEAFKKGLEDISLKATDLYGDLQENVLNSDVGEHLKSLKSFRGCLDSRRIKSGLKNKQNKNIQYKKRESFTDQIKGKILSILHTSMKNCQFPISKQTSLTPILVYVLIKLCLTTLSKTSTFHSLVKSKYCDYENID